MARNSDALRIVGEALYGPSWQTDLSAQLEVADRTMRRWLSGDTAIPDGIWFDLGKLCRNRSRALAKLADQLDQ